MGPSPVDGEHGDSEVLDTGPRVDGPPSGAVVLVHGDDVLRERIFAEGAGVLVEIEVKLVTDFNTERWVEHILLYIQGEEGVKGAEVVLDACINNASTQLPP